MIPPKAEQHTGEWDVESSGQVVVSPESSPAYVGNDPAAAANDSQKSNRWETMYRQLVQYRQEHGDCLVPNRYIKDRQLGEWVSTQRRRRKSGILGQEREERLDALGFRWEAPNPRRVPWETQFAELCEFKKREGHCSVPTKGYTENPSLSNWVSLQRQQHKKKMAGKPSILTDKQIRSLNHIGFAWNKQQRRGGPRQRKTAAPVASGQTRNAPTTVSRRASKRSPSQKSAKRQAPEVSDDSTFAYINEKESVFRGTENNQMAIVDPLYRSAAERRRSSLSMGLEDPEAFIRELDTLLDSDTSEGSQKWSDNDRDLIATTAAAVGRQEDRNTMNSISLRVSPSENYDLTNPDIEMVIEKYKSAMFDSNDVEAWDDGTETNNVTHAEDFSDYNEDPGMDSVFMTRVAVGYGSLLVVVLVAAGAVIGLSMGSSDKPDNIPTGTSDQEKDGTTTTNDPNKKKDDTGDGDDGIGYDDQEKDGTTTTNDPNKKKDDTGDGDDGMTPDGGEDVPVVDDGYTPDGGKANETDDGIYEPEPDEPIEPNDPEEPIKTFDPVGNEDPSPNTNRGFFSPVVIAMLALVGVVVLVGIIGIIVKEDAKRKENKDPKQKEYNDPKRKENKDPKQKENKD
eukprot:CAMPEP_0198303598 /NCGR_PEP_ID=MMETSP1449-20131203/56968_1 /TAXON_ID=420275 /ORGANISM="Attheya septentrionalis, Strain CCMP2084" /LENGTH=624 /DNA_ID=CAMNT_0044006093 /DNA_START=150 /DNA_END=2023 /DNA_ORIENTATION=-